MIQSNLLRLRRALLSLSVAASVAAPVISAAHPAAVPAPVPASAAPLSELTAQALADRYATSRSDVLAATDAATRHGDLRRATALRAMADPGRRFLSFDGRDGGRVVEIFGDLATAGHVAVLVPGADTNLDKYGLLRGGALRLHQALGEGYAVVAWLGYRTPATISLDTLTSDLADKGAADLRGFVRRLTENKGGGQVSLLCHSYGGVVCARAAPGLDVARVILTGSPGVGVDNVRELRTSAAVWAGRASHDWISLVPHTRLHLPFVTLGLGTDPVSPGFGARVFAAGDGGHSDYLADGSLSLHNIARIITGQDPLQAGPVRSRPDAAALRTDQRPSLTTPEPLLRAPDEASAPPADAAAKPLTSSTRNQGPDTGSNARVTPQARSDAGQSAVQGLGGHAPTSPRRGGHVTLSPSGGGHVQMPLEVGGRA
ncbi:alpha/beta fold hydrolase [Nonomuraea sp. LP-02]|uniref:alpha/beta hydrolase n=1 Tax=Nonomuraea sp. LP-02 TaxID=3097960 RepID=UPI002E369A73|nr:alpha/beta hydrolase [Nonomuraea sp. LP-02]MED7924172.1 alpha/beta fold hydrolase [Nonomuraea sp. LP-02]